MATTNDNRPTLADRRRAGRARAVALLEQLEGRSWPHLRDRKGRDNLAAAAVHELSADPEALAAFLQVVTHVLHGSVEGACYTSDDLRSEVEKLDRLRDARADRTFGRILRNLTGGARHE